jgi:hypothetical protein
VTFFVEATPLERPDSAGATITTISSHWHIHSQASLQFTSTAGDQITLRQAFFLQKKSVSKYQKRGFSGTEIAHTRGPAATIIAKAAVSSPNLTQIAEPQFHASSETNFPKPLPRRLDPSIHSDT